MFVLESGSPEGSQPGIENPSPTHHSQVILTFVSKTEQARGDMHLLREPDLMKGIRLELGGRASYFF